MGIEQTDADDIVSSLHRIEVLLEAIAVDVSAASSDTAWLTLSRWQRFKLIRKAPKTDMPLGGSVSNAHGLTPPI